MFFYFMKATELLKLAMLSDLIAIVDLKSSVEFA